MDDTNCLGFKAEGKKKYKNFKVSLQRQGKGKQKKKKKQQILSAAKQTRHFISLMLTVIIIIISIINITASNTSIFK